MGSPFVVDLATAARVVARNLDEWSRDLAHFRKVCITFDSAPSPDALDSGSALWGCGTKNGPLSISWRWVEVRRGVVALADPMALTSNALLKDRHGNILDKSQTLLQLNWVVHELDWQSEVRREQDRPGRAVGRQGRATGRSAALSRIPALPKATWFSALSPA